MASNTSGRLTRGLSHDKGSRIKSVATPPTRSEGKDGDMQIHNGHLYIKDKYTWHHFVSKSEFKADKIGVGLNTETPQTELKYVSAGTIGKDFNTLMTKINQIIERLQLDIK
jgi:hypothetical protein